MKLNPFQCKGFKSITSRSKIFNKKNVKTSCFKDILSLTKKKEPQKIKIKQPRPEIRANRNKTLTPTKPQMC